MSSEVSNSIGSYELIEQLGEGGMGTVYKARHRKLDRIVALKIIKNEKISNKKALARFQREAKSAAKLSDPHIVAIYDAEEVDGINYIAMEYMEGTDLGNLVKKKGPLPIPQACEYIRQAALGLQHAFEKGLIHRDIKPANLFLAKTDKGEMVKVLDFGLTLVEDEKDRNTRLTQVGNVVGTVDYMSPEQATDSRKVDIRGDIYSLGCTLFYLLTGSLPFEGKDMLARLSARVLEEPRVITEIRKDIAPALGGVVKKMLAKNAADRYQTPAELAMALQPFVKQKTKLVKKPHRKKLFLVILSSFLISAIVLACIAGYFLFGSKQSVAQKPKIEPKKIEEAKTETKNLLQLIDPEKDKLWGDWTKVDGNLIGAGLAARLQIPYKVSGNYTLRMKVKRLSGSEFVVGFIVDKAMCSAIFGDLNGMESSVGIPFGGSKSAVTPVNKQTLAINKESQIEFIVKKNSVKVSVDNEQLYRYEGPTEHLMVTHLWFNGMNRKGEKAAKKDMIIIAFSGSFSISQMELVLDK